MNVTQEPIIRKRSQKWPGPLICVLNTGWVPISIIWKNEELVTIECTTYVYPIHSQKRNTNSQVIFNFYIQDID